MSIYTNSQVTQGQVGNNPSSFVGVDCNLGVTSARVLFDVIPNPGNSLSGTNFALTYTNTANNGTGVNNQSSGTGTIYVDGAYQRKQALGTVVYQGGGTWTFSISAVTITNGGLGYFGADNLTPPTVTFSAPASGSNRTTGVAIVGDGNITGIRITNSGSGYAEGAATVTIAAPNPHHMYLQMRDRSAFKFTVPATGNTTASQAVTLTPVGLVTGPDQLRLRNLGII